MEKAREHMKPLLRRSSLPVSRILSISAALIAGAGVSAMAQAERQVQTVDSGSSAGSTVNPRCNVTTPDDANAEILKELRQIIHTDDSVEVKYYDRPDRFLDKMAFSFTGDLGCEYGGKGTAVGAQGQTVILNTNCFHDTPTSRKQTFAGWMAYNPFWFKKDIYAVTR